jgi:outer membrane protein TolC
MCWKRLISVLTLATAAIVGCQQQCFLPEADFEHYQSLGLPPKLDTDPNADVAPRSVAMPEPSTVLDPDRPVRFLSLTEAIAIALEQGTTGSQSAINPGFSNDTLATLAGTTVAGDDAIRVLSLDPAIVGTNIESSLAKFDAQWVSSMTWNSVDVAPNATGLGANSFFSNGQNATLSTALLKPLPTGGVAGITFLTNYQDLNRPISFSTAAPTINPAYAPELMFQFEQPLLQGFGVEINQLRATHPGTSPSAQLTPLPLAVGGRVEGILITRLRFDQQRTDFQRSVHYLLYNVEVAYWNLYGAYWALYSNEAALRQAYEAWKINRARYEAGRIAIQDYAQTRQQYELFRGNRLSSLGQVLEAERQLRGMLGMPPSDGTRLVPVDAPTLTPYRPDWKEAVNESLARRPELILARQDLKFRQLDLITAKNLLLPDLRFISAYNINGVGSRLDGPGEDNALRSFASDRFTGWTLGLRMTVPLGYRDQYAQLRATRLNLARSYLALRDQENKAELFLAQQYRHLQEFYAQIEAQRAQRIAAAEGLEARFKEFLAGRGTLDILLEAQRVWAAALQTEYANIVLYNNALAGFEFAKGTIMEHDSVYISEGNLPRAAQVRAVEHERQRSKAIVLRERADTISAYPSCGLPKLPGEEATPVPTAMQNAKPLPDGTPEKVEAALKDSESRAAQTPQGVSAGSAPTAAPRLLPDSLPKFDQPPASSPYLSSPNANGAGNRSP